MLENKFRTVILAILISSSLISCKKSIDEPTIPTIPIVPPPSTGTVVDIEGNVYKTIKIGTQTWMIENLKTIHFNDSTIIPKVLNDYDWIKLRTPAYCWSDAIIESKQNGALYNWYAVNTNKLAPKGWHIPSYNEWTILENYLISNAYNYNGSTSDNLIGKSLASQTGWASAPGIWCIGFQPLLNNKSGFSGQPCAFRSSNGIIFENSGASCDWWSSTEDSTLNIGKVYSTGLSIYYKGTYQGWNDKEFGFSVRCIKNE